MLLIINFSAMHRVVIAGLLFAAAMMIGIGVTLSVVTICSVFQRRHGLKAFHAVFEFVQQSGPAKRRELTPCLYLVRGAAASEAPLLRGSNWQMSVQGESSFMLWL